MIPSLLDWGIIESDSAMSDQQQFFLGVVSILSIFNTDNEKERLNKKYETLLMLKVIIN